MFFAYWCMTEYARRYGFGRGNRLIETYSASKTITAALMGVGVARGLYDLDTPIAQYGVRPGAIWNSTGVDFFPNITARHLLAQVRD
jgi:CubicO group peptidase (beta-lactamase class C family)